MCNGQISYRSIWVIFWVVSLNILLVVGYVCHHGGGASMTDICLKYRYFEITQEDKSDIAYHPCMPAVTVQPTWHLRHFALYLPPNQIWAVTCLCCHTSLGLKPGTILSNIRHSEDFVMVMETQRNLSSVYWCLGCRICSSTFKDQTQFANQKTI